MLVGGSSGLSSVAPDSVGVIDPASNALVAEVAVGVEPEAIAVGEGAVWSTNVADETVSRIDPDDTSARSGTITVGGYPSDVAVGAGTVWVALGPLAQLVRINSDSNEAASPTSALGEDIPCSGSPGASIAIGAGAVWFVCESPALGRFDIRTNQGRDVGLQAGDLITGPSSTLSAFADVAFGLESLWIVDRNTNSIIEVDPVTIKKLRPISVGDDPAAIAVGTDSLWVANFGDDTVTRVQIPGRGQTPTLDATFPSATAPWTSPFGEGAVWVANSLGRSVTRIDPETNEVATTIPTGQLAATTGGRRRAR